MKTKRILSLLLAIVMTLSVVSFSAVAAEVNNADVVINADEVKTTYEVGKIIQVPVKIDSNNGLAVGRVTVTWDNQSLALTSVTFGEKNTLGQDNHSPKEGSEVNGEPTEGIKNDGSYPVSFGSYLSQTGWDTTGELFVLNFKVLENCALGNYVIGLTGNKDAFLDAEMNEKTPAFTAGKITVYKEITGGSLSFSSPEKGDAPATTATVNGDFTAGSITWTDAEGSSVGEKFAANTVYKARITLTAQQNYEFAESFVVESVDGIVPEYTRSSATEVVVTFTFDATAGKLTQTINASDMTATFGDNAKTLTATTNGDGYISYEVTAGQDVISIDGDSVKFLGAGEATIKIMATETDDYAYAEKEIKVTIAKSDYTYEMTATEQYIKVGSDLAAITIAPNNGVGVNNAPVNGTLKWYSDANMTKEATTEDLKPGNNTLYWSFVSSDSNYVSDAKTGSVTIHVIGTGDVNGDGKVTDKDAMILFRYLDSWENYAAKIVCMAVADINGDGEVGDADAMYLARCLAGWEGYTIE